jgi:ATP-dependent Lon protease
MTIDAVQGAMHRITVAREAAQDLANMTQNKRRDDYIFLRLGEYYWNAEVMAGPNWETNTLKCYRKAASMIKAGIKNPVFLLDDIDKVSTESSHPGNLASALLEVLDPIQNKCFRDNYLRVGFDLSQVFFVCSAANVDSIPEALKNRMEIIQLSGYTLPEKLAIPKDHLIPKHLSEYRLDSLGVAFEDGAIECMIQEYTKEAGVRELNRAIDSVTRKLVYQYEKSKEDGAEFDPVVTADRLGELLGKE